MGPHTSRTIKPNELRKPIVTTTSIIKKESKLEPTSPESAESADDQPVQLITNISDVDFTREYHGVEGSEYFLPSDVDEQDRLELQHYLLRHLFKGDIVRKDIKESLAKPGSKILDVGCANGWWLDSVSKVYTSAEFYGVEHRQQQQDLAESVIEKAKKLFPTAVFTVGNVVTGLPFEDNTFDVVHQRFLCLGLPTHDFPVAIRELMRITKPGGWIELVELDITGYRHGPIAKKLQEAFNAVLAPRKLDLLAGTNLVNYVAIASKKQKPRVHVKQIERATVSMPCNWGGPIGTMFAEDAKQAYYNMEDFLHKQLDIERDKYKELVDKMIEESKVTKGFTS